MRAAAWLAGFAVGVACAAPPPSVPADDRRAEIAAVRKGLQARHYDGRAKACRSLEYSGIVDAPLFDYIERHVLDGLARLRDSGPFGNRPLDQAVSWCAKALAYSGSEKYRPTLEKVAASGWRAGEHAAEALGWIDDFARWNAIINDAEGREPGHSGALARALNMIRSEDLAMKKAGLRAIEDLRAAERSVAYDAIAAQLLADRGMAMESRREDVLARYARALGRSGNPKYRPLLEVVADESGSAEVRAHAERAAEALEPP